MLSYLIFIYGVKPSISSLNRSKNNISEPFIGMGPISLNVYTVYAF